MSSIDRKDFLKQAACISLGFSGLGQWFLSERAHADSRVLGLPLVDDPKGTLDLPKGFTYSVIARKGTKMSDGLLVPGAPDGMGTFAGPAGETIIVCNHELSPGSGSYLKKGMAQTIPNDMIYDVPSKGRECAGGTSTIVFDTKTQTVKRHSMSLTGTIRNCAGGVTPWGTWVTCEECFISADQKNNGSVLSQHHGYNFEVTPHVDGTMSKPVPLKAMGRFNHEAIAVDAKSGVVYQTEDRGDGLIYRFIPKVKGQLAKGGKLQALKVIKGAQDTRNWNQLDYHEGQRVDVQWVDMDEADVAKDDLRAKGTAMGAAIFARGEGAWAGDGEIFWACTNGGKKRKGQLWKYIPSPAEGTPDEVNKPAKLQLFLESPDTSVLENGDNLTIAPSGNLYVCEDRSGKDVRIIGVTAQGKSYVFARNHKNSEFAGVCFSPDGSTMFVNIQKPGLTLAITGPWDMLAT